MRRGFTLIELMIALALAAVLLPGAAMVLDQLGDETTRISMRKLQGDDRENGRRLLRELLRRVDASPDSAGRFVGDAWHARFRTECAVGGGWLEPCGATLRIAPLGDSTAVQLEVPGRAPVICWVAGESMEFRFLSGAAGEPWVTGWQASIVAPGAVGIVTAKDTVVILAGIKS